MTARSSVVMSFPIGTRSRARDAAPSAVLSKSSPCDLPSEEVAQRDLELLARLCASDPVALDALVHLYWRPLVAYAARLLPAGDGAEDVAQEVFIRLWERRALLAATSTLRPLLYRIARNIALNTRRGWRVREAWRTLHQAEQRGRAETPLQAALHHELERAVDDAIQALSPRRREAFILARFHDMSYRQIATIMGVSTQTVANQISAALADLRHALEPFLASDA